MEAGDRFKMFWSRLNYRQMYITACPVKMNQSRNIHKKIDKKRPNHVIRINVPCSDTCGFPR